MNVFVRFDLGTHYVLCAGSNERLDFVGRERQRVAHAEASRSVVLEVGYGLAFFLEFLRRIEGDISMAAGEELVHVLFVEASAFALPVRAIVAPETYALVEVNAQPGEGLDDILFGTGHEALRIGIFDSENQFPAMLLGEQVIIQGGTDSADVQGSRRTGGKTHSNLSFTRHNQSLFKKRGKNTNFLCTLRH